MTAPVVSYDPTEKKLRKGAFWSVGLLVLGIVLGLIVWSSNAPVSTAASKPKAAPSAALKPTPTAKPAPAPTANEATIKKLTVDYKSPSVSCVALVKAAGKDVVKTVYLYDVGVRKEVQKGNLTLRQWSDAISTPLPGKTASAKKRNLQVAICLDPYLGSVWGHMFATLTVGNVSILKLNPWLQPYVNLSTVNDKATSFGTMFDPQGANEAQATKYIHQNASWQQDAEAIDTLIGGLDPLGVMAKDSVRNWDAAVLVARTLPEVELAKQPDKLDALVLGITQKGACAPLGEIGANVGDKRPEVFKTPVCAPAHKPAPTPVQSAKPKSSTPQQALKTTAPPVAPSTHQVGSTPSTHSASPPPSTTKRYTPPTTPNAPPNTYTPPPNTYTPPPSTTACVRPPSPGSGYVPSGECSWKKPPQSWNCQQNGGPGCPPNPAHQAPQSAGNSVQSTATKSAYVPPEPKPLPTYHPPSNAPHAPPTTNNSSGYNPPNSTAPGGGAGPTNGPATTVKAPKPTPTPSRIVPTSAPVETATSVAPPP